MPSIFIKRRCHGKCHRNTGLEGVNPGYNGGIGYQLSHFQLNLLYQAVGTKTISETKTDIEGFCDYRNSYDGNTYKFPTAIRTLSY